MAILEKEVLVSLTSGNIKQYEELGYIIERYKDKYGRIRVKRGTKLLVKVGDLQEGSNVILTKICDNCGLMTFNQTYNNIMKSRISGDGKDKCYNCSNSEKWETRYAQLQFDKSLEFFAIENKKEYLLEEFSGKNNKKPNEVFKGSTIKYIWKCNICYGEYHSSPNQRTSGERNCPYCSGRKILKGYNDLWTTHPEIAKLLENKEIGYTISAGMRKKVTLICDKCNHINYKQISVVIRDGFSCNECSDSISYPEKILMSLLKQLNITDFKTQKSFKWSLNKRYDFFIPSISCIIETHGKQHYEETGFGEMGGRSLIEEKENDNLKENLAMKNGINHYVIIDCSISDHLYIKNNILKSKLGVLFNLGEIDWLNCHEFACNSSFVKTACDLWNSGIKSTKEIGKILKLSHGTIMKYLKQGNLLGWCNYNSKDVMEQNGKLYGGNNKTKIVQLSMENEFIQHWNSMTEAGKKLGVNFKGISNACQGRYKSAGGFKWMYKLDYEKQIINQN